MIEHGLVNAAYYCEPRLDDNSIESDSSHPLTPPIPDDRPKLSFVSEMDLFEEINSALVMTDAKDTAVDFSKSHLAIRSDSDESPGVEG